jgi:hypothetical protein
VRPPSLPAPLAAPGDLSDQEVGACEEWLARCFPRLPDAWFRTLWVLVRLVKEDRREWHQMTPREFLARGTHLKESAQREALRELARANLVEKCRGEKFPGRQGANWVRPNVSQDPAGAAERKGSDQRPQRTPAAHRNARPKGASEKQIANALYHETD